MTDTTEVLPGPETALSQTPSTAAPDAGEGAAPAAPRSLRDTLKAAFDEDAAKQEGTPSAAPAKTGAAPAAPASGETPARNELGQFVKTADAKGEPKTPGAEPRAADPKAPKTGAEPAQPAVISAPAAWSPAAKAAYAQLPEVVRNEIAKREQDWDKGLAQRSQDAERLNRLHQVLAPYAERLQLAGLTESQAVQQLFAASDYLRRDPVNALIYLAQTHGVDPRAFAQVLMGGQGQQPQVAPEVRQLYGEFQALKQGLDSERSQARNAQYQQMLSQVESFAKDPQHAYFENVREPMAQLVESGRAKDLQDAYEQATWAHPEIRPLLIQQQLEVQQKAAADAARAKSAQARHASGSITGSPSPGVMPGANGSKLSLRDELRKNFEEFSG